MKVIVQNRPALRTLGDEDRSKAEKLIDEFARSLTGKRLKAIATTYKSDDVYVLTSAADNLQIFLEIDLKQETVTVVDTARPSFWGGKYAPPPSVIRVENLPA